MHRMAIAFSCRKRMQAQTSRGPKAPKAERPSWFAPKQKVRFSLRMQCCNSHKKHKRPDTDGRIRGQRHLAQSRCLVNHAMQEEAPLPPAVPIEDGKPGGAAPQAASEMKLPSPSLFEAPKLEAQKEALSDILPPKLETPAPFKVESKQPSPEPPNAAPSISEGQGFGDYFNSLIQESPKKVSQCKRVLH